jgi:serine/threonine-protein phosphatase 2A regulatory subunit B
LIDVVDIKPENMEELSEVITSAAFHPSHCHLLSYSSSRGTVKVADLRNSALCSTYAKTYSDLPAAKSAGQNKSFIGDILSSISDIK